MNSPHISFPENWRRCNFHVKNYKIEFDPKEMEKNARLWQNEMKLTRAHYLIILILWPQRVRYDYDFRYILAHKRLSNCKRHTRD